MNKYSWIGLVLVLTFNVVHFASAQQPFIYNGVIINSTDSIAVPFATISITDKPIGIVSNENGEFSFNIPPVYYPDSVIISSIGYKTFKKAIRSINSSHTDTIRLQPELYLLAEVSITARINRRITKSIIKNSIAKIPENYNTRPFLLAGYFREYVREDDKIKDLKEAALEVEDGGFLENDDRTCKVRLLQTREAKSFNKDSAVAETYDNSSRKYIPGFYIDPMGGNEFSILRSNDPIRNYRQFSLSFINNFSKSFIRNHRLRLDSITVLDKKQVYCIGFDTYYKFNPYLVDDYHVTGSIFIRTDNFAIVKLDYNMFSLNETYPDELKIYELKTEYREYKGKMYLNYLSFGNYFQVPGRGFDTRKLYQYREFFVNHIYPFKYDHITDQEQISNTSPLFKNHIPVIEHFWDNYNKVTQVLQKN